MKFSCPLIRISGVIYPELVKRERYIFLLFLVLSLLQLWTTRYVPSLDGPQHLYTSNILKQLALGNDLFREFFRLSDGIVGYWTAHAVLTFFNFIFPPWLAEKLFLTAYLLGMVFAFRYLVRSLNASRGNLVTLLIFPFIFHSYFMMGYYAFSVAVIFFFLAFGYWIRHRETFSWKDSLVFGAILLGLFLSHAFVFALFGFSFVLYLLAVSAYSYFSSRKASAAAGIAPKGTASKESSLKESTLKASAAGESTSIGTASNESSLKVSGASSSAVSSSRGNAMKLLRYAVAAVPAVVLWALYMRSVLGVSSAVSEPSYSAGELVHFLLRIRQLVGFHHELEAIGYVPLFVLIVLLTLGFLVLFVPQLMDRSKKLVDLLSPANALIFVALGMLALYFFAPDKVSAGSLTNRFGLFFFLAMITWLSMQKFPKTLQIISLVVVLFSVTYTRITHHRFLERLNRDASEIAELGEYMEPNNVVHYLQASNNWVHVHFQLYATAGKPLVNIKTTQNQGQFVTRWNAETLPRCYAGDHEVRPAGAMKAPNDRVERQIDYITVFKYNDYMQDSTNADWHQILQSDYEMVHTSSRGNAVLFQRK